MKVASLPLTLAAAVLATAALGGPAPAAGAALSASTYLHTVCPALKSWQADLTSASNLLQSDVRSASTLSQAKTEILAFLGSASARTDLLIQTVTGAGVPNVKNGAKIADALNAALMKLGNTFLGAGDAASSLPTDDPATFSRRAEKLGNTITAQGNAVQKSLNAATKKYKSPQLDQAAKREHTCKGFVA